VTPEESQSDLSPVFIKHGPCEERLQFIVIIVRLIPKSGSIEIKRKWRSPEKSVAPAKVPLVLAGE
jgi:hypothetical protein